MLVFGRSVASDTTRVIIGAPEGQSATLEYWGRAYVFVETGGAWILQATLAADPIQPGDLFGRSVAIHGDYAVVGALSDDERGTDAGAAYAFLFHWNDLDDQGQTDGERRAAHRTTTFGGLAVGVSTNEGVIGAMGSDTVALDAGAIFVYPMVFHHAGNPHADRHTDAD
jgi:hypothetical protein